MPWLLLQCIAVDGLLEQRVGFGVNYRVWILELLPPVQWCQLFESSVGVDDAIGAEFVGGILIELSSEHKKLVMVVVGIPL